MQEKSTCRCNPALAAGYLARVGEYCAASRAVAQLGSALEWGSRGRGFESRRPDFLEIRRRRVAVLRDLLSQVTEEDLMKSSAASAAGSAVSPAAHIEIQG